MRYEIRRIKQSVKEKFPDCKLSVKYIPCHNWASSGDKIQIKTDIPFESLMEFLRDNTEHIAIYKKGEMAFACNNPLTTSIFGYNDSEADFIEIDSSV